MNRVTKPNFAIIPQWMFFSDLPSTAIVVFGGLHAWANNETGECWPSNKTIADRLGVSVSTVQRSIKELEEVGALVVEREQFDGSGAPTSNRLFLRYPEHDPHSKNAMGSSQICYGGGSKIAMGGVAKTTTKLEPNITRSNELEKTNVVSAETNGASPVKSSAAKRKYTEAFEAFWHQYRTATPKPSGSKFNAAKQWAKLSAEDRRAAHHSVGLYCAENEFTKHAERYLAHREFDSYDGLSLADVQSAATPTLPMFRPKTVAGLESIDRIVSQVFANDDPNRISSENQPPKELNR